MYNSDELDDFVLSGAMDFFLSELFEDSITCQYCDKVIELSDKVECVDEDRKKFKCPYCGKIVSLRKE